MVEHAEKYVLPFITLVGTPVGMEGVEISFENYTFRRGCGTVGRKDNLVYYSSGITAFGVSVLYVPGRNLNQNTLLVSRAQWEYIKNGGNTDNSWVKQSLNRFCDLTGCGLSSCKESALYYCKERSYDGLILTGIFEPDFYEKMRQFQEKLEHPAEIKKIKGAIEIKWGEWWKNSYYKLGWLMLAIRIAQQRETLNYHMLKQKFEEFSQNNFESDNVTNKFTHALNWRNFYSY